MEQSATLVIIYWWQQYYNLIRYCIILISWQFISMLRYLLQYRELRVYTSFTQLLDLFLALYISTRLNRRFIFSVDLTTHARENALKLKLKLFLVHLDGLLRIVLQLFNLIAFFSFSVLFLKDGSKNFGEPLLKTLLQYFQVS